MSNRSLFPYATSAQRTVLTVLSVASVIFFAQMMWGFFTGDGGSLLGLLFTIALGGAAMRYHEHLANLTAPSSPELYDWAVHGL